MASEISGLSQVRGQPDDDDMKSQAPAAKVAKTVRASFLERFFAKYEFNCRHMLSCSDCEAWTMAEVLSKADDDMKKLWDNASLGYTESLGDPMLLQEIWARYRDQAIVEARRRCKLAKEFEYTCGTSYVEQDLIHLTTCVPVEGIYVAMSQLLGEGDHVICLSPAYQALYEIAKSKGCTIIEWKPIYNQQRNFWSFDIKDLERLLAQEVSPSKPLKMLVLNAPHNPTGACFSQSQYDQISDLLDGLDQSHRPILFSDEMYSEILESRPSNVAKQNSIVLSGLSKPWGMPGLRVGWLLFQNRAHFEKVAGFRDYTTLCLPPQCEILSIIALRNAEKFLERNRGIVKDNYARLQAFLLKHDRWFFPLNQHEHNNALINDFGPTLFVRLKLPLGGHTNALPDYLQTPTHMVEHLAQKHSVCLVASDFFEFFEFPCVRFGIGRANFADALDALGNALEAMQ